MAARKLLTIAIAGNPNCGKTALFNALTGARQHVGNWPGVTVEKKEGYFELGDRQIRLVDLPGTYALFANAEDERAAVDYLLSREASLIINIVDATNLERNLFLTSQLADMKIPMVIAVNMMDIAENRGIQLDLDELSDFYGVPCIPLSAVSEKSVTNFISQMGHVLASPMPLPKQIAYADKVEEAVKVLEPKVAPVAKLLATDARWVSLMYLGNEKSYADKFAEAGVKINKADVVKILGEEPEFAMAENRYSISHEVAGKAIVSARAKKTFSDKLDAVLLNRWAALPIFLVVMYLVFWIAVTIGSAFIDFFDVLFGARCRYPDGFDLHPGHLLHVPVPFVPRRLGLHGPRRFRRGPLHEIPRAPRSCLRADDGGLRLRRAGHYGLPRAGIQARTLPHHLPGAIHELRRSPPGVRAVCGGFLWQNGGHGRVPALPRRRAVRRCLRPLLEEVPIPGPGL